MNINKNFGNKSVDCNGLEDWLDATCMVIREMHREQKWLIEYICKGKTNEFREELINRMKTETRRELK